MGEYDLSKIEDFSERITTVIFWDVEDYPFPVSCSPDEIYQKIESALHDMMSIWAYVDEKKGPAGVSFWVIRRGDPESTSLPEGINLPDLIECCMHDILVWSMDATVNFPN